MKELQIVNQISRLEDAEGLDPVIDRVTEVVNAVFRAPCLRDVLHGVPIGHPLHPLLVQVSVGAWVSAAVLDL